MSDAKYIFPNSIGKVREAKAALRSLNLTYNELDAVERDISSQLMRMNPARRERDDSPVPAPMSVREVGTQTKECENTVQASSVHPIAEKRSYSPTRPVSRRRISFVNLSTVTQINSKPEETRERDLEARDSPRHPQERFLTRSPLEYIDGIAEHPDHYSRPGPYLRGTSPLTPRESIFVSQQSPLRHSAHPLSLGKPETAQFKGSNCNNPNFHQYLLPSTKDGGQLAPFLSQPNPNSRIDGYGISTPVVNAERARSIAAFVDPSSEIKCQLKTRPKDQDDASECIISPLTGQEEDCESRSTSVQTGYGRPNHDLSPVSPSVEVPSIDAPRQSGRPWELNRLGTSSHGNARPLANAKGIWQEVLQCPTTSVDSHEWQRFQRELQESPIPPRDLARPKTMIPFSGPSNSQPALDNGNDNLTHESANRPKHEAIGKKSFSLLSAIRQIQDDSPLRPEMRSSPYSMTLGPELSSKEFDLLQDEMSDDSTSSHLSNNNNNNLPARPPLNPPNWGSLPLAQPPLSFPSIYQNPQTHHFRPFPSTSTPINPHHPYPLYRNEPDLRHQIPSRDMPPCPLPYSFPLAQPSTSKTTLAPISAPWPPVNPVPSCAAPPPYGQRLPPWTPTGPLPIATTNPAVSERMQHVLRPEESRSLGESGYSVSTAPLVPEKKQDDESNSDNDDDDDDDDEGDDSEENDNDDDAGNDSDEDDNPNDNSRDSRSNPRASPAHSPLPPVNNLSAGCPPSTANEAVAPAAAASQPGRRQHLQRVSQMWAPAPAQALGKREREMEAETEMERERREMMERWSSGDETEVGEEV